MLSGSYYTVAVDKIWILFPAVTMSLGWGLRGYIGGGPLGAMIPGALVALALCLLLKRENDDAAIIAALGAVGVGFGGQMTYGQTIGLAIDPATRAWGLTGLTLKGAIWGLLGGAVIGIALTRRLYSNARIVAGFGAMIAATWIGWKLLNEPKLIYFSNRLDRPRPEIWFGLMVGAIALLAVMRSSIPTRFAAYCTLGGGFGFGMGGYIQVLGRTQADIEWIGWWKVMEFFFGFFFGVALGYGAWKHRNELTGTADPAEAKPVSMAIHLALALAVVAGGLLMARSGLGRFVYTVAGSVLMSAALYNAAAAWHVGITMTYCAFAIDFLRARPDWPQEPLWAGVVISTAAVAWLVTRYPRALPMFLLLTWTANVNALMKSYWPLGEWNLNLFLVQTVFVLEGVAATWFALKIARRSAVLAEHSEQPALHLHV